MTRRTFMKALVLVATTVVAPMLIEVVEEEVEPP